MSIKKSVKNVFMVLICALLIANITMTSKAQTNVNSVIGIGLGEEFNKNNSIAGVTAIISSTHDDVKTLMVEQQESVKVALQNLYNPPEVQEVSYVRYPTDELNIRNYPSQDSEIIDRLSVNEEVTVIGEIPDNNYVKINYEGKDAYVSKDFLSEEKTNKVATYEWTGEKLNRSNGTVSGPSGKETYYNLPMGTVVAIMRRKGYSGEYWVREDGAKMLGEYILVAADLHIRPKGTILPTTLGMGIVADTGDFVNSNSQQIDIATDW